MKPVQPPTAELFWDAGIETLPREDLNRLQLERLRAQLDRCASSSLYGRRLSEAGVEPRGIRTLDDFADVPVVTKDDLRDDQQQCPPFGTFAVADASSWRELHPSSGTTGAPVNTIWSAADVDTITDFTARTLWQFGVRPGDVVQNAFAYGLWVAGMSCHYAAARIGTLVIPLGTSVSTEKQIDYLLRARSTVLLSTPSYALHIAEELERRGIAPEDIALRVGSFGGEAGAENPATRAYLESRLGLDAFDYYGLAEIGPTFASECTEKAGLHFAEDHVLVECVDPQTKRPVPEGELGVLVFTHLTRDATPMIRYWSNDYARIVRDPCACGRTHARAVGGILGRHDDLVVFKGAKFYPSQVEKVVRSFGDLSPEFRVEVVREEGGTRVRHCTIVAEWARAPVDGVHETVLRGLRAELGVTPALRIEEPGKLDRTAFKAARLVVLQP
jgi:phenylacetate-CoA ligase